MFFPWQQSDIDMDAFSKYVVQMANPTLIGLVNQCSSQFTYVYIGPEPDLLLFVVGLIPCSEDS